MSDFADLYIDRTYNAYRSSFLWFLGAKSRFEDFYCRNVAFMHGLK